MYSKLWNKAISAQQKINGIEKGELPEIIEIFRDPSAGQELAFKLIRSVLVVLVTVTAVIAAVVIAVGLPEPVVKMAYLPLLAFAVQSVIVVAAAAQMALQVLLVVLEQKQLFEESKLLREQ
jgi:hypothetical protein